MESLARYFDGETGQRPTVQLRLDTAAKSLRIERVEPPRNTQHWPLEAIRALTGQARAGQLILSLRTDASNDSALITTARLTIEDREMIAALRKACPNLNRREVPAGTAGKIVTRFGIAAAAIVLMIFVILPAMATTLANYIPIEREVAYGKSVVSQIERLLSGSRAQKLTCSDEKGVAALDTMIDRLTQGADLNYDLNVAVFKHPMINAFAAPGGQIIVMRGLIDKAESPDEVAAVLGHEIGHVEARDTTRNALRAAGSAGLLSLVLGDFAGGSAVLVAAEYTLNAAYTREAEAKADIFALNALKASGTNAAALAEFFDRLENLERSLPELPEYLSSHPETKSRSDAARAFAKTQGQVNPILDKTEWAALKGICS